MRALRWYWGHFRYSLDCETYWPWQKAYWKNLGEDDREYDRLHPKQWPWTKEFWLCPRFKRAFSFIVVILGINLTAIALMLLVVLASLPFQ